MSLIKSSKTEPSEVGSSEKLSTFPQELRLEFRLYDGLVVKGDHLDVSRVATFRWSSVSLIPRSIVDNFCTFRSDGDLVRTCAFRR